MVWSFLFSMDFLMNVNRVCFPSFTEEAFVMCVHAHSHCQNCYTEVVGICIFMQADDSLSWSVLLFIAHCLWTTIACEILGCKSHIPFLLLCFCSLPTFVHDISRCVFCASQEIVHLWSGCFVYGQYLLSQTPRAVSPPSFPPLVLSIPPLCLYLMW